MSFRIPICNSCGRAAFPPRLLCPRCGGPDWREQNVESGVLEAVTERGGVRLGAVRLTLGPLVIVRVEGAMRAGAEVQVGADADVPVARESVQSATDA